MYTCKLTKDVFPLNDYAKKGIIQFQLLSDNTPVNNVVPKSITYTIQTDEYGGNEVVFNGNLQDDINFYELENGKYRFDVFFNPYKKKYRLNGVDDNKVDTKCHTDFLWHSGFGYNAEYRTDELNISRVDNENNVVSETIYYKLHCIQSNGNDNSSSSSDSSSESQIDNENKLYQWVISLVNVTNDTEEIIYTSGIPSLSCKDSIPPQFIQYGVTGDYENYHYAFLTSEISAETDDLFNIGEISLVFDLPGQNDIEFILTPYFFTQHIFSRNENWKDFNFIPEYSPLRNGKHSKTLEFDDINIERTSNSFITKIIPSCVTLQSGKKKNIPFIVNMDGQSSNSSDTDNKTGQIEFVTDVSVRNYTYKTESENILYASDFFKTFKSDMPYTNYIIEFLDNTGNEENATIQHIFRLYQSVPELNKISDSSSDTSDNGSNFSYVKGVLLSEISIIENAFTSDNKIVFETLPENNGEVFENSTVLAQFTLNRNVMNNLKRAEFMVKNEVVQYQNNIGFNYPADYFMRNGKFIEFTILSSNTYLVQREALKDYLGANETEYAVGDFYLYSCFNSTSLFEQDKSNENILSYLGVPTFKKTEIVFFYNNFSVEEKQSTIFTKNQIRTPDFMFKTKYVDISGNETYFDNLCMEKIEISENAQTIGQIYEESDSSSSESDEVILKYPYIFNNAGDFTSENLHIIFSGQDEPVTTSNDISRLLMPDDKKLDGEYYHLKYPFGDKLDLTPDILDVRGIASRGDDNSDISLQASNANGKYFYVNGEGNNRVFKHETDNYYIRYWGSDNRFCITTSESPNENNTLCRSQYYQNMSGIETSAFPSLNWGGNKYHCSFNNFSMTYIEAEKEDGKTKVYYFRFYDKYGNMSEIANTTLEIYKINPYEMKLSITGSSGSLRYSGFYQKHGRFLPSEFVEINFSAASKTSLKYRILSSSSLMNTDYNYKPLGSTGVKKLIVKLMPETAKNLLLYKDIECRIEIEFLDEAGNTNVISKNIKYITQLHRTLNFNLLNESENYSHELYIVNNTTTEKVSRKRISTTEYYRSWNEIWFPESHGTPLNSDGTINETEAFSIAKISDDTSGYLTLYDKLSLDNSGSYLVKDSDGRYLQNMNAWNKDKKYPANLNKLGLNSDENDYKYWIIDNTGNPDFKLEFEVFDFDGQETTIPANYSSPYAGDCVVIYDASAVGCTGESVDENGKTVYTLKDSSKLKQLFALKGSYIIEKNNEFRLISDEISENLVPAGSGFTTPSITSTSRICIIPFSDSLGEGSGFKLKAGPKHLVEYVNYESIEKIGEFWVHKSPETANGSWIGCATLQMNYSYYGSFAVVNREPSTVKFDEYQNNTVLGTYTHYLYLYTNGLNTYPFSYFFTDSSGNYPVFSKENQISLEDKESIIKTFMLYNDDLVDYSEPVFYVIYAGEKPEKTLYYNFSNYESEKDGRLSSNYTINKDTGVLTFNALTPLGRISGDYYYHTFYRLTSDGYGDLSFYNQTLVPATAQSGYTDYTWVDLKIVNEGTNQLTDGTLKFLARGYITAGTVVDTVLDNNRPWDVQKGTVAETVQRTGANFSTSYDGLGLTTRQAAVNAINRGQTCTFGNLGAKESLFARVFWCIATNGDGSAWIDCTRGDKLFSAELSGKFYIFTSGA